MNEKIFTVTTGSRRELVSEAVTLNGVSEEERLTPKLARRAAMVAFGHCDGVTVSDGKTAYRLYVNSARKLQTGRANTAAV